MQPGRAPAPERVYSMPPPAHTPPPASVALPASMVANLAPPVSIGRDGNLVARSGGGAEVPLTDEQRIAAHHAAYSALVIFAPAGACRICLSAPLRSHPPTPVSAPPPANPSLLHLQRTPLCSTSSEPVSAPPAGAGKTLTLVHRIAYLTSVGGITPPAVLCLTFTRKAAGEIRDRLRQLPGAGGVEVSTFHGWCLRLVRTFAHDIGKRPDFRLSTTQQQVGLLRDAIAAWQQQQGGAQEGESKPGPQRGGGPSLSTNAHVDAFCKRLQRAIGRAKLVGLKGCQPSTATLLTTGVGAFCVAQYDEGLARAGLLDMGDLQLLALRLMQIPRVRASITDR
jgi:hypothetical protein